MPNPTVEQDERSLIELTGTAALARAPWIGVVGCACLVTGMALILSACAGGPGRISERDTAPGPVEAGNLLRHVQVLSADDFEGRAPGTPGETRTVAYIAQQFRMAGLRPWHSSEFAQAVSLRKMSASGFIQVQTDAGIISLDPDSDVALQLSTGGASLAGEDVVFAGFGIVAPELGRDDFAGIDVRNRIVIVLAGEPEIGTYVMSTTLGAPAIAAFRENQRTYHRWDWVKQLRAMKHGAKAVLIVVPELISATKRQYFEREYMFNSDLAPWAPPISGLLTNAAFSRIAEASGHRPSDLRQAAALPTFRPSLLGVKLRGEANVEAHALRSTNLVGAIRGSGKDCVVLTAHWDGYGHDLSVTGDGVWNGAVDDAGGVAQLIEIARSLARKGQPIRSILFVATTGEERGYLGARHFLVHNGCQGEIAAVINLDWFYELGRTAKIVSHGLGYSSLDANVERLAQAQQRSVTAVNAYFAGGDQLPFLLAGIPAFHGGSIGPPIDRPAGFEDAYYEQRDQGALRRGGNSNRDEVSHEWDLSGAVQDAELVRDLAVELANAANSPCWTAASEFAALGRRCR